jgi:hypothetical protein
MRVEVTNARGVSGRAHAWWRTASVIAGVTLAVHGLLLLNDGVYWDGHLIYSYLHDGNWAELLSMFREAGSPQTAFLHWALGSTGGVFLYKLAAFVAILAGALAIWRLAVESHCMTTEEAAWVAVLAVAYPGSRVNVEIITTPSLICYACFLCAAWIDSRATRRRGGGAAVMHLAAGILFLASFTFPALLAFFVGYIVFVTVTSTPRWPDRVAWLLILIAAAASRWFLRPTVPGLYAVMPSLRGPVVNAAWFVRYAVYGTVNRALADLLAQPLAILALLSAFVAFARIAPAGEPARANGSAAAYSIVLLLLAIAPFAAVGKYPLLDGWDTRHALLLGLPLAIAITAFASMAERLWGVAPSVRRLALTAVVVAFAVSLVKSYLSWQARWVKDSSVVLNLARTPGAQGYSIFLVEDRFPAGEEPGYAPYEWTSLIHRVWGGQTHAALYGEPSVEEIGRMLTPLTARFNRANVDVLGCEARLLIERGPESADDLTMAIGYTYKRFFRPDHLPELLEKVTKVSVTRRAVDGATDCRSTTSAQ